MLYLESTLSFILMMVFPKWFCILCDCALCSYGERTVQSDSSMLFFPVFRYGVTDFLITVHKPIFFSSFSCVKYFVQKS